MSIACASLRKPPTERTQSLINICHFQLCLTYNLNFLLNKREEWKLVEKKILCKRDVLALIEGARTVEKFARAVSLHLENHLFAEEAEQEQRSSLLGSSSLQDWIIEQYNKELIKDIQAELAWKTGSLETGRRGLRWRGLLKRKDFYAVLIQPERNKHEHLYVINSSLSEPTEKAKDHGKTLHGHCRWDVKRDIQPGIYQLEFGSRTAGICAVTEPFRITETFCMEPDDSTIGVWCLCGEVHASVSGGQWVACSECSSWHHWACYARRRLYKSKALRDAEEILEGCTFQHSDRRRRAYESLYEEKLLRDIKAQRKGGLELQILGHDPGKFIMHRKAS